MPRTKKKKGKKRECDRGYPCGGSCISRGYNCKKKLKGQGKDYADWLKIQGNNLGSEFDKEAGTRLSKEANSRVKITRTNFKSLTDELLSETNEELSEFDKGIISQLQDLLRLGIGDPKENQAEIDRLEKDIAKREQRAKQTHRTPKNQIQPYGIAAKDTDRVLAKSLEDKLVKMSGKSKIEFLRGELGDLKDSLKEKANQVVPFKKKRTKDFSEANPLADYLAARRKLLTVMSLLIKEFGAIANA